MSSVVFIAVPATVAPPASGMRAAIRRTMRHGSPSKPPATAASVSITRTLAACAASADRAS
jgi:hypothetical protein